MKLFIIGPQPPLRGGISNTNKDLCTLLAQTNEVEAISFSRLFPKFFFREHYNKEISVSLPYKKIEMLDALNPFSWNRTADYILTQKPDRVLFQWWTTYLFACYLFLVFRLKGKVPLGVLVHDFYPHGG